MDQYNAFISYSHDDSAMAERISKRLRRYKAPKKTGLNKKLTVFRDVERLTTSPDLSDALTERLKASEKLILLCSPSAKASEYVTEEIDTFLKLKSYDELLFVVCRGKFEEGIPQRLRKEEEEPLYIDLSNANKSQFRDETLRLIAALYGVDYAKLFREDEKLKRKRRNILAGSLLMTLFLIFSGFLITTTQPEAWERIPQPDLDQDFMPIHEFVVNEEDPTIILYKGQDAKWGMNPRPKGFSFHPSTFLSDGPDFNQYLSNYDTSPLVRIRFQLTEKEGAGEIDIYGIMNSDKNELNFFRSLKFDGITEGGIRKQIRIPPNMESITEDPYNLAPWPLDTLQVAGLYSEWDTVEGLLINLISGEEVETSFDQLYLDEGFDEMVEVWEPEYRVFSNLDAESLVVLGDTLHEIQYDDEIWDPIVKSLEWKNHNKPRRKELGSAYESNREAILNVVDSIPQVMNRDSLISKLIRMSAIAEFSDFTLVDSERATNGALVIEIKGFIDSHESIDGIPLQWLFRGTSTSAWYPIQLPNTQAGTSIIDLISISSTEAFIVTDTHGFYLTEDGGLNWREANFGETNLGNGQLLKTIVAGTPLQLYCLADRNTSFSDGENALYRFIRRNWMQRWKAGLVNLLE